MRKSDDCFYSQWHSRIIDAPGLRNWQNFSIVVTLFLLLPSINLVTKEFRSSSKQLQLNTTGMSFVKYWVPIYIVDILIYIICLLSILSVTPILYVVKYDTTIIEIGEIYRRQNWSTIVHKLNSNDSCYSSIAVHFSTLWNSSVADGVYPTFLWQQSGDFVYNCDSPQHNNS